MKSYSSKSYFKFEIERAINKETGEYFIPDDIDTEDDSLEYQTINLAVTASYYYDPGHYAGLPEDCYPDESVLDVESAIGPDNTNWWDKLTDPEKDDLYSKITSNLDDDYDRDSCYDY